MLKKFKNLILAVAKDERGSEFVEYPMFAVTLVVVALPTVVGLRTAVVGRFTSLITAVDTF